VKDKLFGIALLLLLVGIVGVSVWNGRQAQVALPGGQSVVVPPGSAVATETAPAKAQLPPTAGPFELVSVAERSYQQAPAIAVTFAAPLDTTKIYDRYLTLTRADGQRPEGGWVLSDDGRILFFSPAEPEKEYQLQVSAELPSQDGRTLGVASSHSITTRPLEPAFGFASRGSILPAKLSAGLPIRTVNVPEVDVEFLRVRDQFLVDFINEYLINGYNYWYNEERGQVELEQVYFGRFGTEAKPNTRTVTHLPVEDIAALRRPGLYIAYMKRPGPGYYDGENATFFHVTDIGLQLRLYNQSMQVHTASLASGQPLSEVQLTLFNGKGEQVGQGRTDIEGNARLEGKAPVDGVLLARSGEQIAFVSMRQPALDLGEFPVTGAANRPMEVFVTSGRDLYRPGERIQLLALLRNQDGQPIDHALPLHLNLVRPDGKTMQTALLQPQGLGDYTHTLGLPANAATGLWRVELRADPSAKEPDGLLSVHVEEFLPERMRLSFKGEERPLLIGEPMQFEVLGEYLYGAPASDARLDPVLHVGPAIHPIEGLPEYFFGDADEANEQWREELPSETLDKEGRATLTVDPLQSQYHSPMRLKLTASLFEPGGRPVTRSFSRTLWPDMALLGVRPSFGDGSAPANELVDLDYLLVNQDGSYAGADNLIATVIREDRDYYWSYTSGRGWHYEYTETPYPVHEELLNLKADGPVGIHFPVEYGRYRVEVKDVQGKLLNRFRFTAGWLDGDEAMQAANARPDRVNMSLDRPAYGPGDLAKLTLVPPHAGQALVTLDSSDGQLWHKEVYLPAEGATVEVPLDPAWLDRHDLYLGAVVLRPGEAQDRVTPNRAIGLIHLPLDRTARTLQVELELPEQARPETRVPVKVRVPAAAGQTVRLQLSAVDLGILNITRYQTPDPARHYFSQRRYGVELYDLYGRVIEARQGVTGRLRFGGDMDLAREQAGALAQAQVELVSLFQAPVVLDAQGEATIELPVPDFNGAVRVMAVAYGADRFGMGEAELKVAAPVVVQTSLPRFLAGGDQSLFTVTLDNRSGADQTLKLAISADLPLRMEAVTIPFMLPDGERRTLQYPLVALPGFGMGAVHLSLSGEGVDVERTVRLQVRPAHPAQTRMVTRRLLPGESYVLPKTLSEGLLGDALRVRLDLSLRPYLDLVEAFDGLQQYPYGCLEQTTSRAFPLIYDDDALLRGYGVTPLAREGRVERVEAALQRLLGMQLSNGGFTLWGDGESEEGWLGAYVVDFLLEARDQGFNIPGEMLEKGLARLAERLNQGGGLRDSQRYSDNMRHLVLAEQAYAGYVLARAGRAQLGTLRTLADGHASDAASGLPLLHLGLALELAGDTKRGKSLIAIASKPQRSDRLYFGDYGSPLRDDAMMVALLLRHEPQDTHLEALIERLTDTLSGTRWYSTQERLALYLAARQMQAGSGGSEVLLKRGEVSEQLALGRLSDTLSGSELGAGVEVKVTGESAVYLRARANGYPMTALPADNSQVRVVQHLYSAAGKPLKENRVEAGEMLIVQLQVEGAKRRVPNALVEALLPAGLELENLNLSEGEGLQELMVDGVDLYQAMENASIRYQEYRDDRYVAAIDLGKGERINLFYLARAVTPGEYSLPSPLVSDMYHPVWRGHGEGGQLVIQGRTP